MVDFAAVRRGFLELGTAASHAASGQEKPKVAEIFAPLQHAGALDPDTTIVLGARGAGKSFWAGVLGGDETRAAAAEAYPRIGLSEIKVSFGFTGISGDGSVSRATLDERVAPGSESTTCVLFWRCVMLRAMQSILPGQVPSTIRTLMTEFSDPEVWEEAFLQGNEQLSTINLKLLVVFDALDSLAVDWERLRRLLDGLLEVVWSLRGYSAVRSKLFMRPDQLRDLGLRFVELPKLIAGATNLTWSGVSLYGMLFARLGATSDKSSREAFKSLLAEEGLTLPPASLSRIRRWSLSTDSKLQARVFTRLAGLYMGKSNKKGRTYDWPINHLADGHGEVTPRSFLTLMDAAARYTTQIHNQAITAEGIRHGLREASKVRVDQLDLEFRWIKRVLAPLARVQVPSTLDTITGRWEQTATIGAVLRQANTEGFLPPFDQRGHDSAPERLIARLITIGVLTTRNDGRYDMPDLFRVAARLLKKGGVAPS